MTRDGSSYEGPTFLSDLIRDMGLGPTTQNTHLSGPILLAASGVVNPVQALVKLHSAWAGRTSKGGLMLDIEVDVVLICKALMQELADG